MSSLLTVTLKGPFSLPLSLEATASFLPRTGRAPSALRLATRIGCRPAIIEIRQIRAAPAVVEASSTIPIHRRRLQNLTQRLVSADLDLRPFYRMVADHPIMGPRCEVIEGMAVIAITEQQLSLAAAFHMRARLINRFGTPIGGLWTFPTPEVLAGASLRHLRSCGLSLRKAEYIKGIAQGAVRGTLALDALERDADVRAHLLRQRGLGEWSAQYILARGPGAFRLLAFRRRRPASRSGEIPGAWPATQS
jgi:3-methyladenine DNA glycosylase/8-oxoguanine DNA glycosylase